MATCLRASAGPTRVHSATAKPYRIEGGSRKESGHQMEDFIPLLIHFSYPYQIDLHTSPATAHFTYTTRLFLFFPPPLPGLTPSFHLHLFFPRLPPFFSPSPSSHVIRFSFLSTRPSLLAAIHPVLHPRALRGSVAVIMKRRS